MISFRFASRRGQMNPHRLTRPARGARRVTGASRWIASFAVSALVAAVNLAAAPADSVRPEEAVTSVRQFWQTPPELMQRTYRVRFEMVVAYYDPVWNLLWAAGDDGISFIFCGPPPLPIQARQRVLIDGRMSPATGLSMANATVQVLAENEPLAPVVLKLQGSADDAANLPTQWVEIEGFVNHESEVDPTHLLLDMTVQGRPVQARVLVRGSVERPQCESAFVRVHGLLVPNLTPAGKLSALALWIPGPDDLTVIGE